MSKLGQARAVPWAGRPVGLTILWNFMNLFTVRIEKDFRYLVHDTSVTY